MLRRSRIGEFRLAPRMDRLLPTSFNPFVLFLLAPSLRLTTTLLTFLTIHCSATCEYYHPSVLARPPSQIRPDLLPLLKKPELFVKLGTWEQAVKREWTLATKLAKVGEGQEKAAVGGGAGMAGGSQDVARPSSVTSFTDNESPHPSLASSTSSLPLDKPAFVSSATSLPPYLPLATLPAYPRAPVTAPSTQPPFDEDPDPFAVLSRRKKGEPTVLASARRLLHRLEIRGRHIVAQRYA